MCMSLDDVVVLHEYGAPSHFRGLSRLAKEWGFHLRWVEFDLPRQVGRKLLRRRLPVPFRFVGNVSSMASLAVTSGRTVIASAAPFDDIVLYLQWLQGRHRVIYHTSWPFWDGVRFPRRPVLGLETVNRWRRFLRGIEAVAVTPLARDSVSSFGARAVYIPHSVDTRLFRPRDHDGEAGLAQSCRVLFVGALAERKGFDGLLRLMESWSIPGIEFWIVGRGPLQASVERLQRCRPEIVRYIGYIEDQVELANIYRQADMLVLPSVDRQNDVENFGLVLLEAMASGLPVVASASVGPSQIVQNGVFGYLTEQGDNQELAEVIARLAACPALRREMGMRARAEAEQHYSVDKVAAMWGALLERSREKLAVAGVRED